MAILCQYGAVIDPHTNQDMTIHFWRLQSIICINAVTLNSFLSAILSVCVCLYSILGVINAVPCHAMPYKHHASKPS